MNSLFDTGPCSKGLLGLLHLIPEINSSVVSRVILVDTPICFTTRKPPPDCLAALQIWPGMDSIISSEATL